LIASTPRGKTAIKDNGSNEISGDGLVQFANYIVASDSSGQVVEPCRYNGDKELRENVCMGMEFSMAQPLEEAQHSAS